MEEALPPDAVTRVRIDFGPRAEAVLATLAACRRGGSYHLGDRLVRCVIFAARGDETRLAELIELRREDYRDVIMAAEYDNLGIQRRDFNKPFESAEIG